MIGFYYYNVVLVEIKRFQFKLVCVELNIIGLLALINIKNYASRISEQEQLVVCNYQ